MIKRILTAVVLVTAAFFANAQEIRDISTIVNLFGTGNAQVIQKWDVTVTDGTEYYIPIDNLGKSHIHDFMVYENGEAYESDGRKWNSNRSLEAKTRRCGIVEKSNGNIELCWGQGAYGDHVYTVTYIIDNLVQSYPECDGFHWHFLNDEWSVKPQHVSIAINNETDRDPWYWASADSCNVRYWGFGMEGESWMDSGSIFFESTEPFSYSSFFSALVQFDKGLFLPQVEGEGTFEELKQEAMEGSDYKTDDKPTFWDYVGYVIFGFIFIVIPVFFVGWMICLLIRRIYRRVTGNRYNKDIFGKTKITGWWRDVPFGGNPAALYSLIQKGDHLHGNGTKAFPNVVSAFFLKWIQDGLVKVEKDVGKEGRVNLRFTKTDTVPEFDTLIESRIYEGAVAAAGDNILEADEFKKWSYDNERKVVPWPSMAVADGRDKFWKAASQEERCHAIEFMNFLKDFTLVNEREAPEVGVWKQYMVLAASLGIADKVAKNFEKLFPKVMEEYARSTNMTDSMTTYYILDSLNRSSRSMMSSAVDHHQAKAAARAAAERRSSGGGGSISFGGGHGGFGGGHGGGSR